MSLDHLNMQEPPVKSWSYSKLKKFEKCAYAVYLSDVKKETKPVPKDDAPNVRGTKIHKEAEDYVQGIIDTLPASLKKFKDDFLQLKETFLEGTIKIEDEWPFDKDWNSLADWWDKNVWCRIKTDVIEFFEKSGALIIDYKTGKKYGNEVPHTQQGQLYAISAFMRYPQLDVVTVEFWYLDEGKKTSKMYRRDQIGMFLKRFTERAEKMTTCVNFKPRPNIHTCRWCDYGPQNGTNTCPYGVAI